MPSTPCYNLSFLGPGCPHPDHLPCWASGPVTVPGVGPHEESLDLWRPLPPFGHHDYSSTAHTRVPGASGHNRALSVETAVCLGIMNQPSPAYLPHPQGHPELGLLVCPPALRRPGHRFGSTVPPRTECAGVLRTEGSARGAVVGPGELWHHVLGIRPDMECTPSPARPCPSAGPPRRRLQGAALSTVAELWTEFPPLQPCPGCYHNLTYRRGN